MYVSEFSWVVAGHLSRAQDDAAAALLGDPLSIDQRKNEYFLKEYMTARVETNLCYRVNECYRILVTLGARIYMYRTIKNSIFPSTFKK
jgi:hypothetical protein